MNADSKYKCSLLKDTKIVIRNVRNRNDKRYITKHLLICTTRISYYFACGITIGIYESIKNGKRQKSDVLPYRLSLISIWYIGRIYKVIQVGEV